MMQDLKKIVFRLKVDDAGYPPVEFESIWALSLGNSSYVVDNVPYYVYGVSKGDTVRAEPVDDELLVSSVVARGGHSTLRVFVDDEDVRATIVHDLTCMGAQCSVTKGLSLFAVDIPPSVAFEGISKFLESQCDNEHVAYEDACLQHLRIDPTRVEECKSLASIPDQFN